MMKQVIIALSIFILSCSLPLYSQDVQEEIRVFRGYDNVVVLKDGKLVTDLTKDDFVVTVNGKQVAVESADFVSTFGLKGDRGAATSGGASHSEAGNYEVEPVHYIMLIDVFNSSPAGNRENIVFARRFLESLDDRNFVSIFEFNFFLKLITPGRAVPPSRAVELLDQIDKVSSNAHQTPSSTELNGLKLWKWNQLFEEKRFLYQNMIKAIKAVANGCSKITYQNVLILMGEGFTNVGPEMYERDRRGPDSDVSNSAGEREKPDARTGGSTQDNSNSFKAAAGLVRAYAQLGTMDLERMLNGYDMRVFTVRRGLLMPDYIGMVGGPGLTEIAWDHHGWRLNTLRTIAEMTNGQFFPASIGDTRVTEEIVSQTSAFYRVFFKVPPGIEKQDYNKLEIRVKDDGCKVIHKKGFFGPEKRRKLAEKENRKRELTKLQPLRADIDLFIQTLPNYNRAICATSLDPDSFEDTVPDSITESITVFDMFDHELYHAEQQIEIKVPVEGQHVNLTREIDVPGAAKTIVYSLVDNATRRGLEVKKNLSVNAGGSSVITLAEPYFIQGTKPEMTYHRMTEPFKQGDAARLVLTWAMLEPEVENIDEFDFACWFDSGDKKFGIENEIIDLKRIAGGVYQLQVIVPVGCAQAPETELHVAVEHLPSGNMAYTVIPVSVQEWDPDTAQILLETSNMTTF